ncbi:hypothetical protein EJ08DRAFT_652506 [Tothia fuscella]|uniref:Uncharacterized protein n=1 Tax=Tothia fuscella TaxID=1048955 RepID=A0A9P4TVH5_9PEZI|nr:hypothetical protein EJ08DRAFT_652506 [Tothia fuscella]
MTSTPPPPGRIHTPPTPLHGPKFDSWEPYSPRRSSRVANKRTVYSHSPNDLLSIPKQRSDRACTPSNPKSSNFTRTSSQTFSPPSSPASPSSHNNNSRFTKRSNGVRRVSPGAQSGSDTDIILSSSAARTEPSSADSFGMLQTPAKTPRKRAVNGGQNGTSRVLFGRPVSIDDAMPSPRKARKAKLFNPLSIAEEGTEEGSSSKKIQIYTDSKDRVPALDEDASNPFLSKNAAKPNKRQKKTHFMTDAKMEEAVKNDEGLVYVFRGKKIFRKFEDDQADGSAASDDNLSDLEIRRRAGTAASRPFTRSSIKPRLLFPSEDQQLAHEADEEADTDIEVSRSSPSKKRNGAALGPVEEPEPESVTPVKSQFGPATPPTTGRAKRGSAKKDISFEAASVVASASVQLEEVTSAPSTSSAAGPKSKRSPFDGWSRSKAGSSSGSKTSAKGMKREGDVMIRDGDEPKRTRSGAWNPFEA